MQRTFTRLFSSSTTNPLKVYGFPISQPFRSVLLLLKENNIPYDVTIVDPFKGETRKPQFREISPTGLVPIVIDNGFTVSESGAIMQYLAETRQLNAFYPLNDVKARANINFWLYWNHTNTRKSTPGILVPHFLPPKNDTVENAIAPAKRDFTKSLQFMENHLKSRPNSKFLASEAHPTIADLMILPELDQLGAEAFNIFDYSPFPRLQEWKSNLTSSLTSYPEVFKPVQDAASRFHQRKK